MGGPLPKVYKRPSSQAGQLTSPQAWDIIRLERKNKMETKRSWWKLTIDDYPNYKPNDIDLEHIAELIKQGYDQGELIQEIEDDE